MIREDRPFVFKHLVVACLNPTSGHARRDAARLALDPAAANIRLVGMECVGPAAWHRALEIPGLLAEIEGAKGNDIPDVSLAREGSRAFPVLDRGSSPLTKSARSDSVAPREQAGVRLWQWVGKGSVRAT